MRQLYKPMLARSVEAPFTSKDWIFEIKWDGIRAISYVNEELSIRSRNGKEMKHNFPELAELKSLCRNIVIDGEIVVMSEGRPDFQSLLERSNATSTREIRYMAARLPATYVVFDILEENGRPLVELPLMERKRLLKEHLKDGKHVVSSMFVDEDGEAYFEAALNMGLEGIMAKRKDSTYQIGMRSDSWIKVKKIVSCDCVIFGYTAGEGARADTFGALILGLYDKGQPVYVGKVGTGFSQKDLESLMKTFKSLETNENTLEEIDVSEKITWLKPELVCEVAYQSVTNDGKLRMPRFRGLRADKAPLECTLDPIRQVSLQKYLSKRDLTISPEPSPARVQREREELNVFVVQEHHARRLHYDLRLERQGVLKSWAVPKGIPEEAGEKRLAVETENHPLEYSRFEGVIPPGQYGAGTVKIWDRGSYELKLWENDKIEFVLKGERLHGRYVLVRFKKAGEKEWVLLKAKD